MSRRSRDKLRNRLAVTLDNDFFAFLDAVEKLRELRLGFRCSYGGHGGNLGQLTKIIELSPAKEKAAFWRPVNQGNRIFTAAPGS